MSGVTRVEGFAAIPNWMVRDKSISLYAVAVYVALASHTGPGGIHPSQATLAAESRCSERKVRDALQELRELGVVESVVRRRKGGKSTTLSNGYVLHPNGHLAPDEEAAPPAGTYGEDGKLPAPGAQATGTSEQVTPSIKEEPIKKSLSIVSPSPDELFEAAWKHWPRNENKKKAREKFARLKNQVEVAAAIVEHGDAHAKWSGQFVPHLITWLNGERWDDPLPGPRRAARESSVEIGRKTDAILRARAAERERLAVSS